MKPEVRIIYENDHLIVIYKPAGLPVQTASVAKPDVCSYLKGYLKGGYLGVVHRLDQPVEGLLVFAKDKNTAADLTAQLSSGELKKTYRAVVYGKGPGSGTDVCYMKKTPANLSVIGEGEDYKRAELAFELTKAGDVVSEYRIRIGTGRFHQIRSQMAHLGLPILGDLKYGSKESIEFSKEMNISAPALCADTLEFTDHAAKEARRFSVSPENRAFTII